MKLGDRIEWTYKRNGRLVTGREQLWSTIMNCYVPIGSSLIHTLVSIDDEQITWVNEEGCFHARVDDKRWKIDAGPASSVVPHVY